MAARVRVGTGPREIGRSREQNNTNRDESRARRAYRKNESAASALAARSPAARPNGAGLLEEGEGNIGSAGG